MDTESFIKKATLKHNGKYIYKKSRWINCKTPVTITCPIHGDFNQNPNNHLNGEGCPKCGCQKSTLEDKLKDAIKKEGFHVESRVSMKWLGKQSLDLLIKIDTLLIAIECQGIGHYETVKNWVRKSKGLSLKNNQTPEQAGLTYRKKLDLRKKRLCKEHGITLLYFTLPELGHYDYTAYTSTKSIINRIKEIIENKKQG